MKTPPPKHARFIDLVAGGETLENAYLATSGNDRATSLTARTRGSKLAKRYAIEIDCVRQQLRDTIQASHRLAASQEALKSILSKAERMQILTKIVNGEIKVKNKVTINGKEAEVEQPANLKDRISAIGELNKMDGSYAPIELNEKITEIRRTVISKKV